MVNASERKYVESLFPAISEIKEKDLREKVANAWILAWKEGNYDKIEDISWCEWWSDKYSWSNVDHTNQVTSLAITVAKFAEETMGMKVNKDVLIAGAILHDLDKAVLCDGKTKKPTDWLKKMPHGSYSAYMALKVGLPLDVAHILASHTAFSVQRQKTVEALILHMVDYLTADLRNFKEGVEYMFSQQAPHYVELP